MRSLAKPVRFLTKRVNRRIGARLIRLLPARTRSFSAIVEHRGVRLRVHTGGGQGYSLYWFDEYEPEEMDAFVSLIRPGTVLFDVGANTGLYSLVAASLGATVYAFEPSRLNQESLRTNLELNDLPGEIRVVDAAVSNGTGEVEFFEGRAGARGVGKIFAYGLTQGHDGRYPVPSDTLDRLADRLTRPDMIKMDIEGAEWLALQGAEQVFGNDSAPDLLIEFHPREIAKLGGTMKDAIAGLRTAGYHGHELGGRNVDDEDHHHRYVFSKRNRNDTGAGEESRQASVPTS